MAFSTRTANGKPIDGNKWYRIGDESDSISWPYDTQEAAIEGCDNHECVMSGQELLDRPLTPEEAMRVHPKGQ